MPTIKYEKNGHTIRGQRSKHINNCVACGAPGLIRYLRRWPDKIIFANVGCSEQNCSNETGVYKGKARQIREWNYRNPNHVTL